MSVTPTEPKSVEARRVAFGKWMREKPCKAVYGTSWKTREETVQCVTAAIKEGKFKAVDSAPDRKLYDEQGVGIALSQAATDVYVMSRFFTDAWYDVEYKMYKGETRHKPFEADDSIPEKVAKSVQASLRDLRVNVLDGYAIADPQYLLDDAGNRAYDHAVWRAIMAEKEKGTVGLIGLSCFPLEKLKDIQDTYGCIDFVQMSMSEQDGFHWDVVDYCQSKGIAYQAFGTLRLSPNWLQHPTTLALSAKYRITPGQVITKLCGSWGISLIVGPKEIDYIRENVCKVEISDSDCNDGVPMMGVTAAIEGGEFEAIDTAPPRSIYDERSIGEVLAKTGADVFITSRFFPDSMLDDTYTLYEGEKRFKPFKSDDPISVQVSKTIESSKTDLGVKMLDGCLVDTPQFIFKDAASNRAYDHEVWEAMMEEKKKGSVGLIGLTCYPLENLKDIQETFGGVDFVQMGMSEEEGFHWDMIDYCREQNIAYQAYGVIRLSSHWLNHESTLALAKKYNITPGQVLLKLCGSWGIVPVTGPMETEYIKENVCNVEIGEDDSKDIEIRLRAGMLDEYCIGRWRTPEAWLEYRGWIKAAPVVPVVHAASE